MPAAQMPPDEAVRLAELRRLGILDTLPEAAYDAITYLASAICDAPIAVVSLVDEHRQWFKSRVGIDDTETPRDVAFCAHAILEPTELLIVNDASVDERFADNPLVRFDPSIRFYAGAPLKTHSGNAMGTLCVIDTEPRKLTDDQEKALRALATQVVALFELRLAVDELNARQAELEEVMRQREMLIATVSHEIRTPLTAVSAYIDLLRDPESGLDDPAERRQMLDLVFRQAGDLNHLIDDLLVAARAEAGSLEVSSVRVNLAAQVAQVLEDLDRARAAEVQVEGDAAPASGDPNRVRQVVRNLLTNALRYGGPKVAVTLETDNMSHVLVTDDGPPIPPEDRERIFEAYRRSSLGREAEGSVGLGLAISRLLTEAMGGTLTYRHEDGNSVFDVALPLAG